MPKASAHCAFQRGRVVTRIKQIPQSLPGRTAKLFVVLAELLDGIGKCYKQWFDDNTVDGEPIYESSESTVRDDAVQLLRRAVIDAKEKLSFVPTAVIDMEYAGKRYQREINVALSNSFGFGGTNASLVVQRVAD